MTFSTPPPLDPSDPNYDPFIGKCLGKDDRFVLHRLLGRGGIGSVYLAVDRKKSEYRAVKLLHGGNAHDPEWRKRFLREGRRCAEIKHPNVARVHQLAYSREIWFIVFEYIEGVHLAEYRKRTGILQVDESLRIAGEIAKGISAAHEQGVIHRDLKPENIMIKDADGGVKVIDFGIAKSLFSDTIDTEAGVFVGTVGYAAPEQIRGQEVTYRSDIFSLGAILFEMVTDQLAFDGDRTTFVLRRGERAKPTADRKFIKGQARPLRELIETMMKRRPKDRPESMAAVAEEIATLRQVLAEGVADQDEIGIIEFLKRFFEGL